MTKPNLGKKQTCKSCGTRFFDFNKNPPVCPKCGEEIKISKSRSKRGIIPEPEIIGAEKSKEKTEPGVAVAASDSIEHLVEDNDAQIENSEIMEGADDIDIEIEGDEDENLMEDTSDVGGDNDDLSEVLDHVDEGISDN